MSLALWIAVCWLPTPVEYDVFAWGGVAYLEVNLAIVRPFVGLYIGSADDDEGDEDLNGFAPLPAA